MAKANALSGTTVLDCTTDGIATLTNAAGTDFTRLTFGGTTNAYPAIVRNGANLQLKTADSAGWAQVTANGYIETAYGFTAGTMTKDYDGYLRNAYARLDWTNAMIVALGAVGTGNILVATMPAKAIIRAMWVTITTAATFAPGTLTFSVGHTGAGYIDYLVAGLDLKAAANTIYGNAAAHRGTNATGYDFVSATATTALYMQIIAGAGTLDGVTTSTGSVHILYDVVV